MVQITKKQELILHLYLINFRINLNHNKHNKQHRVNVIKDFQMLILMIKLKNL